MGGKELVIWGAGKIGRGFVADLFQSAGYGLTFVDADGNAVDKLRSAGKYLVMRIPGKEGITETVIKDFRIYTAQDHDPVSAALSNSELLAVCVFPAVFPDVAAALVPEIEGRARAKTDKVLDILICANTNHPSAQMKAAFSGKLSAAGQKYFDEKVGLIDTAVMRMAISPSEEQLKRDQNIVVTNGYEEMPVDETAFRGAKPDVPALVFVKDMRAEETRKMYTYNMLHALYAYVGKTQGQEYVYECTQNPVVEAIAEGAIDEVGAALSKEFGYSPEEMARWKGLVLRNMANPTLMDKLVRVGGDPERKLKRTDRLVGPALLCRKNGILPFFLTKAIAAGFVFDAPGDPSSAKILAAVEKGGIKAAVKEFCGLDKELDLIQAIAVEYRRFVDGTALEEDPVRVRVLKKAYELGFKYEKSFRGCAQCTIAAMQELTGIEDPGLFQSASGLSGGIAITGDGSCGGYVGGVMFMSSVVGRRKDRIPVDGDKVDQYKSYEMSMKLHDAYMETYGSVNCMDIHQGTFGKAFNLRTKAVRDEFEAAGGHLDKCTTVIAVATMLTAGLMLDEGLLPLTNV